MENKFVWILYWSLLLENSYSYSDSCKGEPRCIPIRTHGMKAADCSERNFKTFPKCVSSDVEVLELSYNRIRKISKSDLSRFKYLKILYLKDNLIVNLNDETFKDLDSLNTLDLSLNGITRIPPTIFQLPSLITLYLSQNLNINIADAIEQIKPISSPLTVLDISLTTDEESPPPEFPDLGPVPLLASLNITRNQYVEVTPKKFAGLCNLQILSNANVSVEYGDNCDCWIINNWLKERKVQFTLFRCPYPETTCLDRELSEDDKRLYNLCRDTYHQIQRNQRLSKIGIGVGIAVAVLIIIAAVFLVSLRRRRRNQKRTKSEDKNIPPHGDGFALLNNQTKTFPHN